MRDTYSSVAAPPGFLALRLVRVDSAAIRWTCLLAASFRSTRGASTTTASPRGDSRLGGGDLASRCPRVSPRAERGRFDRARALAGGCPRARAAAGTTPRCRRAPPLVGSRRSARRGQHFRRRHGHDLDAQGQAADLDWAHQRAPCDAGVSGGDGREHGLRLGAGRQWTADLGGGRTQVSEPTGGVTAGRRSRGSASFGWAIPDTRARPRRRTRAAPRPAR